MPITFVFFIQLSSILLTYTNLILHYPCEYLSLLWIFLIIIVLRLLLFSASGAPFCLIGGMDIMAVYFSILYCTLFLVYFLSFLWSCIMCLSYHKELPLFPVSHTSWHNLMDLLSYSCTLGHTRLLSPLMPIVVVGGLGDRDWLNVGNLPYLRLQTSAQLVLHSLL